MTPIRRPDPPSAAMGSLPRGARVLAAVSGGADSVALLRILLRTPGIDVRAAHLDHGLRDGSRDDAAFVAALCARLGVPLVSARRRVRRRRGESPEDAARRVRYAFLAEAARDSGCDVVATAHHRDDQAETVLYRVLRGAGLDGLRGILPETEIAGVRVVRPLLAVRRAELRRFLAALGEDWREDPTNVAGNDRAILRNEVLPLVRRRLRRDPAAPLARLAGFAQDEFRRREVEASPRRPRREPRPADPSGTVSWEVARLAAPAVIERLRARDGSVELLDADRVRGTLVVRAPRAGDRFHALGLPRAQRLGHYLQRRGVPAAQRARVRLLCDDDGIVWVAGHGLAARVALGNDTSRVVVTRLVR